MGILPYRKVLSDSVFMVLAQATEPMKAFDINNKVALILQMPKDILEIEDANCTGTKFAYQMQWIQTKLKKQGLISSPKRGFCRIILTNNKSYNMGN